MYFDFAFFRDLRPRPKFEALDLKERDEHPFFGPPHPFLLEKLTAPVTHGKCQVLRVANHMNCIRPQ